ncbi:MAG: hypothetical protein BGO60_00180 [Thiobacillus sp. 65-1059]|nr:MAG: hypothetical protein BGO60_00180 [Thiobacillus sp. 65-1059]
MKRALILVVVLAAIAAAGYWLKRPAAAVAVSCADPLAGCAFDHRGTTARLRFSSQPAPLEAFELSVRAPGAGRISAELQMSGMDMGFNRYDLRPAPDGAFGATVTLPACVSGRRDWVLYLDIDGTRYALPFSTR